MPRWKSPHWTEVEGQDPTAEAVLRDAAVPVGSWVLPKSASIESYQNRQWVVANYGPHTTVRVGVRTAGLLERFLRLDAAPASRIRAFAGKFGLLSPPSGRWRDFSRGGEMRWGETLEPYRAYASLAVAVLRLGRRLRADETLDVVDVRVLREFINTRGLLSDLPRIARHPAEDRDEPPPGPAERDGWRQLQWWRVAAVVNWWFAKGQVHPTVVADSHRGPIIRWSGGLWGALGGQLLNAIRREANLAVCDYCGREFKLGRRPKQGAQRHCCGRTACVRARRAESMRWSRASQ